MNRFSGLGWVLGTSFLRAIFANNRSKRAFFLSKKIAQGEPQERARIDFKSKTSMGRISNSVPEDKHSILIFVNNRIKRAVFYQKKNTPGEPRDRGRIGFQSKTSMGV